MNGSLGRDKVWNEHIWSEIDKAVREEMGRIRVAQKVFPSTVANNVLPVSTNRAVPPGPVLDEFEPLFEISTQFVLTQAQVDGEENVRLAASFARSAASRIAAAEDRLLFFGPAGIAGLPAGVAVTNQPPPPGGRWVIPPGFVAEAAANPPPVVVPPRRPFRGPPPIVAGDLGFIMAAVALGIANLNGRDQPGPYALFVPPIRFAQIFAPIGPGLLQTPGDQLSHVLTGGLYMVNSLAVAPPAVNDIGILVSLGGEPAKIILGSDAITAFTFTDQFGNYYFRVFEAIQMVVRDGGAFQTIQFA